MMLKSLLRLTIGTLLCLGLLWASWLLLQLSLPYTALRPGIDFLKTKVNVYHILPWRWSFYTHVFTALPALLAGFTQFSPWLLRRYPKVHRVVGYVYVVDVLLITGPAALIMSWYANGGLLGQVSFLLQSICWLLFTFLSVKAVWKRRFLHHGNWMLRSYAITLGAVMLRVYNALFVLLHIDMRPTERYVLIAWLSWIPNLILAEILIQKGFSKWMMKKKSV